MSATGTEQPFLSFTAPAAAGPLTPVRFWAEERLTAPYVVTVDVLSAAAIIDPVTLLNQPACLTLTARAGSAGPGPVRHFHGIIRRMVSGLAGYRDQFAYTLELVPKLWFLSQTEDCRVFQQQSADAILQTLFSDAGITDVEFHIYGSKPVRDYTVQMNETDLAFATRLIEEEGWFYFFQHAAGGHTLTVTDQNTAFQTLDQPDVKLAGAAEDYALISRWQSASATAHGKTIRQDYDSTAPDTKLFSEQNTIQKTAGAAARDAFRWPALSTEAEIVTQRARIAIEAAEASVSLLEGSSVHNGFCPGFRFVLDRDPLSGAANQRYVIRSVTHQGSEDIQRAGGGAVSYANSFTCFLAAQTWRELHTVPRPRMGGIYTAVVIGADGEEIHTDQYGRIKVLFPWDRLAASTPGGSVWVRVVQPWTGNDWGVQFLPRVGTEVAVAFIDGDIDRPVVVGGLYNGNQMPPFALPADKTKSGLRTRSSLKGGDADFSEFSFDDKKGSELVFLHAQKDFLTEVENDQTLKVTGCRIKTVTKDETVEIDQNQKLTIKQDQKLTIKQDQTIAITQNQTETIGKAQSLSVGADQTISISGSRSVTIDKGSDSLALNKGSLAVKLSMGDVSVKASLGQVTIEAMNSITLKCGASSITLGPSGITLKGMMIEAKADLSLTLGGLMSKLGGDAMLTVKGGIVMIN